MIAFKDRSFCFTGKLADLKRAQAEREARARGGMITDRINERLHYLVVGSMPSAAWKHGSYGTKIETARELQGAGAKWPTLISEEAFLDALALTPSENSGAVDTQVLIATYRFVGDTPDSFDRIAVEALLNEAASTGGFTVRARQHELWFRSALFSESGPTDGVAVEIRFAKQLPLTADINALIGPLEKGFESIPGIDGTLRWFTRTEGSADYIRLLQELPSSHRIE